jgi:hypothetical protein
MALIIPKCTYSDELLVSINISASLISNQGESMKTTIIAMLLTFSLGLVGCVTTQAGSGTPAKSGTVSSEAKDSKMLTEEDYKRIGVKETGVR